MYFCWKQKREVMRGLGVQLDWFWRQLGGRESGQGKGGEEKRCFRGLKGLKESTPFADYVAKHPMMFVAFVFFFILGFLLLLILFAWIFQTPKHVSIYNAATSTATTRYYFSLHSDWKMRRKDPFAYMFAYGWVALHREAKYI